MIGKVECDKFLVAVEQVQNGARSNGDTEVEKSLMDFSNRAMQAVAQRANQGNHIKAEFVMGQCPATFFLAVSVDKGVAAICSWYAAKHRKGQDNGNS